MLRRFFLLTLPVLALLAACTPAPAPPDTTPTGSAASTSANSTEPSTPIPSASPTVAPDKPVHVSLRESDGKQYGIGMPIMAEFSVAPTDGRAFQKATTVTANGKPIVGAWYFEPPTVVGSALEGHFRPASYWPAHSAIAVDMPIKGLSAGKGLAYDNDLTLSVSIGAAKVAVVDAVSLRMTVKTDGKDYGVFPVSLGAPDTRTARGIKVIMEQGADISMRGPGYFDAHVQWTQRLTYGGEYLHSAPWNLANIGSRSTSNGCTNLRPADAKQLYDYLTVGDVVSYPNADGPEMQLGQGYGDWNVPWATWLTGGAIRTR